MKRLFLFALTLTGLCQILPAAVILSISDSTPGTNPGSFTIASNRALAMSWTQTSTFNNVTIQAAVAFQTSLGGSSVNSIFLTNSIGSGTTVANEIASNTSYVSPIITPNTPAPLTTLFSGLTLGPGTYTLSMFYNSGGTTTWDAESPFTTVADPSASLATLNFLSATSFAGYQPASTFTLQTFGPGFFSVTGDAAVSQVPEPATFGLIALGLGAIACLRRTSR